MTYYRFAFKREKSLRNDTFKTRSPLLVFCLFVCLFTGGAGAAYTTVDVGSSTYELASDEILGSYIRVTLSGLTPYVFAPTGAGADDVEDYDTVDEMTTGYAEAENIIAAVNGGIFYNAGTPMQYCFRYKEPDGVLIAGGVVVKSEESIDHSECDILVVDEDGRLGWTDYWADADALAAGTGYYYDIFGNTVTGKRIISAVTGFVPILIGGEPVYNEDDALLHGFDNYVGHYAQGAARQIIGAREDGTIVLLSNLSNWTLEQAAQAAKNEGCIFAYNLDGGGSAETVLADKDGNVEILRSQSRGARTMPTYIVFTSDDHMPVSVLPLCLTVSQNAPIHAGASLSDIAAALTVTEYFQNTDGHISSRILHSAQAVGSGQLYHTVIDASGEIRKNSVSPLGTLYYVKSEEDAALSLRNNANTRADGMYYDYSTGYTLSTWHDLNRPGEKLIQISYSPGGGFSPLIVFAVVSLD